MSKDSAKEQPRRKLPRGYGRITHRGKRFQARWMEDLPDGTQKEAGESFATYDEAYELLWELGERRRTGQYIEPRDRTVADLMAGYLKHVKQRRKPTTYASYNTIAKLHILPELGDMRLVAVSKPRLQHWIDEIVDKGYAPKTIHNIRMVATGAFNEAVSLGLLRESPARGLIVPPVDQAPMETWTAVEALHVLDAVADEAMWNALYHLALTAAPRPGESRAHHWSDVDWDRDIIWIERSMTRDENYRPIIGTTTKTKNMHAAPLTAATKKALRAWYIEQKKLQLAAPNWMDLDLIFTRANGNFLPYTTWQRKHESIIKAAGVKRITIHGMRHTNATLELEAGTNPKIVQKRLGHKKVETTLNIYSHVSVDVEHAAAAAFESRIYAPKDAKKA